MDRFYALFAGGLVMWISIGAVLYEVLGLLRFEVVFIITFVGLLVIGALSLPNHPKRHQQLTLGLFALVGAIAYSIIVIQRILSLLTP